MRRSGTEGLEVEVKRVTQGRRATNRSRRPTRLAQQLGDSFGPSLKLLHARRSWRSFKPCAKRQDARQFLGKKRRACMMHVMHTCRSSIRSEHLLHRQGPPRKMLSRHLARTVLAGQSSTTQATVVTIAWTVSGCCTHTLRSNDERLNGHYSWLNSGTC